MSQTKTLQEVEDLLYKATDRIGRLKYSAEEFELDADDIGPLCLWLQEALNKLLNMPIKDNDE